MIRPAALALAVSLGSLAGAQEAPPAAPPPAPPPRPVSPDAPGDPGGGGAGAGAPTRVPELLARTPEVARVKPLLGAEILDEANQPVARLDDLAARADGRLVAILTRPDGRLIGLPLSELTARAKPDLEDGSERVTIRSFKLARVSRRLDAAPEIEDKSRLDAAWLARLDEGTLAPAGGEPADTPAPGAAQPAQPAQPAPSDDAPLPLLGALAGRTALDAAGQPAGTIVDVVVAVPKARLAYVVVLLRGEPDGADSLHAVPLAALGSTDDDESVRLKLSLPELRDAPRIDALARLPIDPLQTEEPQATPR